MSKNTIATLIWAFLLFILIATLSGCKSRSAEDIHVPPAAADNDNDEDTEEPLPQEELYRLSIDCQPRNNFCLHRHGTYVVYRHGRIIVYKNKKCKKPYTQSIGITTPYGYLFYVNGCEVRLEKTP